MNSYKYLGVVLDDQLNWKENTDHIHKRLQGKMYCLRKLKSFHVREEILQMFYSSVIGSIIYFGTTCWGGSLNQGCRGKLDKQIRRASRLVGREQDGRVVRKPAFGSEGPRFDPRQQPLVQLS